MSLTAALQVLDEQRPDPLIRAKIRGLMAGYDARWRNAGYIALSIEQFRVANLWNPATGYPSRTFQIAGVEDVVVARDMRLAIMDHKTTSEDISDVNAPYWRQLVIEGQASHYMWLEWLNGRKVDEAIWDVIRKPSISPKQITKTERQQIENTGGYFGRRMSEKSIKALVHEQRETLEMYEARLAYDCTEERPQWYFQRRTIPRLNSEMHEYATELWDHGQDILNARQNDRHVRNSGACLLYGSPCRFLGICSGYDTPDSHKWLPKQQVHKELPDTIEGDGRQLLTNTRIRTFQTCRRKHFYEYELGIEPVDEEEREALYFGRLIHIALAAWFAGFQGEMNDATSGVPASGVGIANANADQSANPR